MLQFVDLKGLKEDFIRQNRNHIPLELMGFAEMWESSANHFVDLFLTYLDSRGLEIRFKHPLTP